MYPEALQSFARMFQSLEISLVEEAHPLAATLRMGKQKSLGDPELRKRGKPPHDLGNPDMQSNK